MKRMEKKWYYFAIFAAIVLVTLYVPINIKGDDVGVKTNLPAMMLGCFSIMILLGAVFNEIGNRTPIIKDYLGRRRHRMYFCRQRHGLFQAVSHIAGAGYSQGRESNRNHRDNV